MNTIKLTKALGAALLLASPLTGAETQYPAADFKPTVVYQDADYIATESQTTTPAASTEQAQETKTGKSSGGLLTENLPIVAIALAVVGIMVWSSKRGGSKVEDIQYDTTAYVGGTEDETGVARYLKSIDPSEGGAAAKTGVARYIDALEASTKEAAASTGVARYLKNRDASAK
ncbi:MAG: hypothetical protein ABFS02_00820 [Pseudomonadota bacterium]